MNRSKNQKGFTLIEAIIIFVAIIVICGVGLTVYTAHHNSPASNSANVPQFKLPARSGQEGITSDKLGNIWVAEQNTGQIAEIASGSSSNSKVKQYNFPSGSTPSFLASDPSNNIWVVEAGINKIAELPADSTAITQLIQYDLPNNSSPFGIASDNKGNIWVAESAIDKIGEIPSGSPAGTALTQYDLPSGSNPDSLITDSEGDVWFIEQGPNALGDIKPGSTTAVQYNGFPQGDGLTNLALNTTGAIDEVWFTAISSDPMYQLGTVTADAGENSAPAFLSPENVSGLAAIVLDKKGNVWFTQDVKGVVSELTANTMYAQPLKTIDFKLPSGSNPNEITIDPSNNVWVSEPGTHSVAEIKP
jgi:streptogramin lyase